MKPICFLGTDFSKIGGGPKITVDVINELINHFDIHLLILCKFNKDLYEINPKIKIKIFEFENSLKIRTLILKSVINIIKYIKHYKIQILIGNAGFVGPIFFILKFFIKLKLINCKLISWEHECIDKRNFKSILIRKICNFSNDYNIVISKKTLEDYKTKFNSNKSVHIYNFVNLPSKTSNYNMKSKLLISVGRLEYEKGFDIAIEVAKIFFNYHKDWKWNIFGDGSYKKYLEKKIKDYNLTDNFILKGTSENIQEQYIKSSIFILPSRREGFSLALVESKLNNLPAVSFDCPCGPNEIITDNVHGYLIPCYNLEYMAEKINYLIENPDERLRLSKENITKNFEFNKQYILNKWKSLLDNC